MSYIFYKNVYAATMEGVCNDIGKLLTGETDVDNLSSSCDKAGTTIDTTYNPPNRIEFLGVDPPKRNAVFKVPVFDDPGQFFYATIGFGDVGNGYSMYVGLFNSCIGTTVSNGVRPSGAPFAIVPGGNMGACVGTFTLWTDGIQMFLGMVSMAGMIGVCQFTRDDNWRTKESGYKPVVGFSNFTANPSASWTTSQPFNMHSLTSAGVVSGTGAAGTNGVGMAPDLPGGVVYSAAAGVPDVAGIGKPGLIGARAGAGYSTGSFWNQGGAVSSISEVYMLTSPTTYSYGDTIEVDGKEGVFAPFSNTTYKVCVRIK